MSELEAMVAPLRAEAEQLQAIVRTPDSTATAGCPSAPGTSPQNGRDDDVPAEVRARVIGPGTH